MLTFQYKAINPAGERIRGILQAKDREDAYRRIAADGLKPLQIAIKRTLSLGRGNRITLKDISHLTHQLAVLLEARISITEGIRSIADQEPNPRLKEVLDDVASQIEGGNTITDALKGHRNVFGDVYIETIHAAEVSGNTVQVLGLLAGMLERQYETIRKVKGALMYPACVVGALVFATVFLLVFVVPKFEQMFTNRGVPLPVPTQIVMAVSGVLRTYWFVWIAAGVGLFVGAKHFRRDPKFRRRFDTWLHRIPFVRNVLRAGAISRFSSVLAIALKSGLNLIDGLEMAGRASGRPLLQAESEKLITEISRGERLGAVMTRCEYLTPFAVRMYTAGEDAGELPRMCQIVAKNYDRDVDHLTKNISSVIEPVITVGLAGIVLILALAIFLPMWDLGKVMK